MEEGGKLVEIEYYYSVSSVFAYFGNARFSALATRHKARIIHKPIFHGTVVPATGGKRFNNLSPERKSYFFREVNRWSEFLKIPVIHGDPKYHYGDRDLPSGMIIAAQRRCLDVNSLSFKIGEALWRDDLNISDPNVLSECATSIGMEAGTLLQEAMLTEVQEEYKNNSVECVAKGVFGSPTYAVGDEFFWGQDRLDFLERKIMTYTMS